MKNKKKLKTSNKYKSYYVIENLCPYNKKIFNTLYKCKKQDELHSVWSYNGQVYAKIGKDDEPTHIRHLDEVDDLFYDDSAIHDSKYDDDGGNFSASELVGEEADETGSIGTNDSSIKGQGRDFSTPIAPITKKSSNKRLSDIAEEELSIVEMRTPIAPITIRV